ncbi:hypothetical protein [Ruminiclostridium cellobioparum]|uniref:Uncharacterized protein n=1 Tax=Ruminiclostridium cellobioparum subsp. termitidis CT1112 TaxID=1195236 RepID=S0FSQ3_RUMCE|nr:hypothetical protein [Ruminiclostridium cellobioparum]EMS72209.1 hypothetical protein CTER_1908 [Ruminiclostridium cellobioparum subsp. termitidis CT1112]
MLPLNNVDSPKVLEWWHLQPIESDGVASDKRKSFLDKDDVIYSKDKVVKGDDIVTFEEALKIVATKVNTDYNFWLKKKDIDPLFPALIIKIGKVLEGVK